MQTCQPISNNALGDPLSMTSKILDNTAGATQDLAPIKNICAFLNAFHVYAEDRNRVVEAHHYCSHLNEDVRQCLIYDSNKKNARLIGVEYMITPRLYATLESSERKLWHSHVFEVKSGMLILPEPPLAPIPAAAWEAAETREMEDVIPLYGKTYHLWQVDKGDMLPLGEPKLMASISSEDEAPPGFWERVEERDKRMGVDYKRKKELRKGIESPPVHPDADLCLPRALEFKN